KNLPCVKHHQDEYGGHFPAWAAVELFTFGMLSSLYSVMQPQDRKVIASQYNTDAYHLQSWILALVEVRNICAHYGRIYNMPLKQSPNLYSENQQYAENKVFPLLLTIKRMITDFSTWNTFTTSLFALVDEYSEAKIEYMGFPNDLRNTHHNTKDGIDSEWKRLLERKMK
ncbi:MAG: Abi family protein, partial [Clostridia bacterium]